MHKISSQILCTFLGECTKKSVDSTRIKVYSDYKVKQNRPKTKQPSKPKALTNLKQYTCERYRDVRGNSQEDSLRVAIKQIKSI